MVLLNAQEIAGLTLQEAYIYQERMNSRLAIADCKLRKVSECIKDREKRRTPHRTFRKDREKLLRENKKHLEELYLILTDHIEELELS